MFQTNLILYVILIVLYKNVQVRLSILLGSGKLL